MNRLGLYMNRLRGYETYVDSVKISGKGFSYDLVLACRKGPYVDTWEYLKGRLNRFRDKHIREVLRIMSGKLRTIDEFTGHMVLDEFFYTVKK